MSLGIRLWVVHGGAAGRWQYPLRPGDRMEVRTHDGLKVLVEITESLMTTIVTHYLAGHELTAVLGRQMEANGTPPPEPLAGAPPRKPLTRTPQRVRAPSPERLAALRDRRRRRKV